VTTKVRVTPEFREAFYVVHDAFKTPAHEVEECKALVAADPVGAATAYFATAALIRAGWRPLEEQASSFRRRIGTLGGIA
jgi:hypothetical protein